MEKIIVMLHKGCGEKHITKFHAPFPIHYGIFLSVGFSPLFPTEWHEAVWALLQVLAVGSPDGAMLTRRVVGITAEVCIMLRLRFSILSLSW